MPVSIVTQRDPFRGGGGVAPQPEKGLRIPQARLLRALMPTPGRHPIDWPLLTRANLGKAAGYTVISGSVTRALDGIKRAGTKMGPAHPGLLARGLVEVEDIDVDGLTEANYRITAAGIAAYRAFINAGGELPPVKDPSICTNNRFAK